MINDPFNMTLLEKLSLIAQVFGKVAYNFWPALVLVSVMVFAFYKREAVRR